MYKFIVIIVFLSFYSCNKNQSNSRLYFGEKISVSKVIDFNVVKKLTETQSVVATKIEGTIISTCAKKGCWMKVKTKEDTILVRFKDYGFFVPKSGVENKKVVMQGEAKRDTISVKLLRHYAEDAGKSLNEIEQIIEPEYIISFLANGVAID